MASKTHWPMLVTLLLAFWGLLLLRADAPWYGIQEAPRIWIPAGVRNYARYGLDETGLMMVRNIGPATPESFIYYSHHPPTIIWIPAAVTQVTGFNELGVRFGFIAITLWSGALLVVVARRLFNMRVALLALLLYASTPMIAYYGRVPGYGQMGVFVGLAFAALLANWLRVPTRPRLLGLICLSALAAWTSWTAVFFVGLLGVVALLPASSTQRRGIVLMGVAGAVALAALFAFYQAQWSGAIDSLLNAFVWRTSNAVDDPGTRSFTAPAFVVTTLVHTVGFTSLGFLLLSIAGLPFLRAAARRYGVTLLVGLFLGALVYQLVFRNASYVHDYYKLVFVPAMAISGGLALAHAWHGRSRWARPLGLALLVVALVQSAGWLAWLHRTGDRPWIDDAVAALNQTAAPGDQIATDLVGKDNLMPLGFYADLNIEEGVSPGEAAAFAGPGRLVYLLCDAQAAQGLPAPQATTSAGACQIQVYVPADG